MTTAGRYISMFLMASGYAGTIASILARSADTKHVISGFALTAVWVSNAIPRPPAKRSAAIGLVNGFGNLGNLCVFPCFVCLSQTQVLTFASQGLAPIHGKNNGGRNTTNPCISVLLPWPSRAFYLSVRIIYQEAIEYCAKCYFSQQSSELC